jgi:sugar lactone lactonase YvrE
MRLGVLVRLTAVFLACIASGCGGGGNAGTAPPANTGGLLPSEPSATNGSLALYVPNDLGVTGNVVAFNASASGNVSPSITIAGSNTSLGPAEGIAFDANGNMYVSNKGVGCVTSCIAVFAPGASGNVAPIRKICGSNTQLNGNIAGVAVDASGFLYVAVSPESILVFAPGANGNVAPVRTIFGAGSQPHTGLASPVGIAVDAKGDLFVANSTAGAGSVPGSITEYAPGASGDATPIATIQGSSTELSLPRGLALANGNIYVVNNQQISSGPPTSIAVFPQGATGNVAPSDLITGPDTLLFAPEGIAVDSAGNMYVTNDASPAYVTVYGPLIGGDAPPMQIIKGSNTGLSLPNLPALH